MIIRSEGLCIGRTSFGNTSQVVTLLAPDHGVLGLLAKGVWRPRNPSFGGPFELAALYEFLFIPRRQGGLGLVTEAQEVQAFAGIRASRERLADAFAIIAFVRQFAAPESGDRGFYGLVVGALADLASGARDGLFRFLARGIAAAGVQPSLVDCAICGRREGERSDDDPLPFSFSEGGVLCGSHAGRAETSLRAPIARACRLGEAPPADLAAAVSFLLDWSNYVVACRGRMLEYPFYVRPSPRLPRAGMRFGAGRLPVVKGPRR